MLHPTNVQINWSPVIDNGTVKYLWESIHKQWITSFPAKLFYFFYKIFLPSAHSGYQGISRNTSLNPRMCLAYLFPFLHLCFHIYGRCISRMTPFISRDSHSSRKQDSLTSLVAPQAEGSQELEGHRMMDNISLGLALPNIFISTPANLSWKSSMWQTLLSKGANPNWSNQ